MSTIKHDSQQQCYRWPQGARPCGGSVRLRLSAPEGCVCTLRLWSDEGEHKLPMALRGYMNGSALYEATLPLPEKAQVLWYYFIVQAGEDTIWYGNNAEQLVFQSEKAMNELGDKIDAGEKAAVQAEIDKVKEALKGTDAEMIKAASESLSKKFGEIAQKIYAQQAPQGDPNAAGFGGAQGAQSGPQGDFVDADFTEVDDNNK